MSSHTGGKFIILSIFGATRSALGDKAAFQHIWQLVSNVFHGSKYHCSRLRCLPELFASRCAAFLEME
ncbi:hypothetical protein PLA107_001220 [Pseudomonas amygdali pv. lachrymans str. M301315]|uniref:Uncharacterized protein n=1 Tax=Pseudomonas amygdali pv. lachrymans str. M301315 TaxID=629260 RepID=A0AAD0LVT5_PSEAV|nr:hypothetical protein B5U27_26725 [Pseudomonas amygdali pv. lachrymans]AXH54105.1 hypothetical protein PLA107_001220 [Pseudomonas amygdali pv. lachrymans str. M301315]PWD01417.1 hypothetical protein CX658_15460 [Pseudomonas amygdali pv. lachrymans]